MSLGTAVIEKVPGHLRATDTVKSILGGLILAGSEYVVYRIYTRRPTDDDE